MVTPNFLDHIKSTLTYKVCKERCLYFRLMVIIRNEPNVRELEEALYNAHCVGCPVRDMENDTNITISKEAN